ncbi:MAG: KpsF/GutQ family sugar-phosphate isomerase [Alphaproteobacteria bacterium]|nr:KpsF/GutQ family sugar-phosphate isomerase [Alphaproteobacteria bacterium]
MNTNNQPKYKNDIASAKKLLETEAEGIKILANELGISFSNALDLIESCKGRIILSGMGKSGLIAQKIAATLASTGTPSFFVHPGEASHGDLGMITTNDVVITMSNSGETSELSDIVAYTRRFNIPLIGITGETKSSLATTSDVALILPAVKEACPLGLAPTTSTTMALALGDAIAVAMLERKGFSAEDFQERHPGGKLGSKLQRVRDIMHKGDEIPLVKHDTLMSEALIIMSEKSLGCLGVTNAQGKLTGVITDGDLRRNMSADLLTKNAADVMTKSPKVTTPDALAEQALLTMNQTRITSLFALEGEKIKGIITVHGCLRAGII